MSRFKQGAWVVLHRRAMKSLDHETSLFRPENVREKVLQRCPQTIFGEHFMRDVVVWFEHSQRAMKTNGCCECR
jgi:hypothetical protein